MPDRRKRGKSVEDRLSKRFGGSETNDDSDTEATDENGDAGADTNVESGANDTNDTNDKSDTKVKNVKEAWNSKLVYLPDELDEPLDSEYDRLVYQCGRELSWKPKKNRHYYPVVVADGIETVSEMDPQTFRNRVADMGLL